MVKSLLATILAALTIHPVLCLHNVTIDESAPAIAYEGTWNSGTAESYSYGGIHKYATDSLASATFSFVGQHELSTTRPYNTFSFSFQVLGQ